MHTHCMIRDVLLSEKKIRLAFYNTYFALYIYIYIKHIVMLYTYYAGTNVIVQVYNIGKGTNILYNVNDVVTNFEIYNILYKREFIAYYIGSKGIFDRFVILKL